MPTGTGKTETILSIVVAEKFKFERYFNNRWWF